MPQKLADRSDSRTSDEYRCLPELFSRNGSGGVDESSYDERVIGESADGEDEEKMRRGGRGVRCGEMRRLVWASEKLAVE